MELSSDLQPDETLRLAIELRDEMRARNLKLVLAESCTAGRVAAALACLPGVSEFLCGSFVVYRSASKSQWLGLASSILTDPEIGPVSAIASQLLASAALEHTSEANLAIAVTGDIGPGAAPQTDGKVFMASAWRDQHANAHQVDLRRPAPRGQNDIAARVARLDEATRAVLAFARDTLRGSLDG